jgi:hypothetical protein
VVRKLVDQHMRHELAEAHVATLGPFVQHRTAEEPDRVGLMHLIGDRLFRQGNAVIKAGQLERVFDTHVQKDATRGEILDPDHEVARGGLVRLRQEHQRGIGERLDLAEAGGRPVRAVDASFHVLLWTLTRDCERARVASPGDHR